MKGRGPRGWMPRAMQQVAGGSVPRCPRHSRRLAQVLTRGLPARRAGTGWAQTTPKPSAQAGVARRMALPPPTETPAWSRAGLAGDQEPQACGSASGVQRCPAAPAGSTGGIQPVPRTAARQAARSEVTGTARPTAPAAQTLRPCLIPGGLAPPQGQARLRGSLWPMLGSGVLALSSEPPVAASLVPIPSPCFAFIFSFFSSASPIRSQLCVYKSGAGNVFMLEIRTDLAVSKSGHIQGTSIRYTLKCTLFCQNLTTMYLIISKNGNYLLTLKLTHLLDFVMSAFCCKAFECMAAAWRSTVAVDPLGGYQSFVTLRAS